MSKDHKSKGKRLNLSGCSNHMVKTERDAVFELINKVKKQAEEDKTCFDLGKPPVGCHGYGKNPNGKKYAENVLEVDPVKEWEESWIFEKVCQYYGIGKEPRIETAFHDQDKSMDMIVSNM